ncbi:hypothetical protein RJ226_004044 [Enterobacter hormaechei]|nr:hypothetical protein [Enterobacter hormaechei]ELD3190832.1 hypothetical protein [Enterobacter hormaechei]
MFFIETARMQFRGSAPTGAGVNNVASHHQTFTTRTDQQPTHKIVAKTNPDAEQGVAFLAYSLEEMTAVRNGISLAAQLFGLAIFFEIFEAEKPH